MASKDITKRRAANQRYKKTEKGKQTNRMGRFIRNVFKRKAFLLPFVGVDGEGGGVDELGRQSYKLLRTHRFGGGDECRLLYRNEARLTTDECLAFLADLPPTFQYVSYYFDYDVTMILRDVDAPRLRKLFERRVHVRVEGQHFAPSIYYDNFELGYFPHKHFKVRRVDRQDPKIKLTPWVTIHDVGSFFQMSFVKALTDWDVLTAAQRAEMKLDKDRRDEFNVMTAKVQEYNALECEALALLMEKFRGVCIDCGILPREWEGPGYLASAMMITNGVTKTKAIRERIPADCWKAANNAYYGGRFEIFKVGEVANVREYDICSAYPASYRTLPCLEHGHWEYGEGEPDVPPGTLYLADVRFTHTEESPIVCHLPIRLDTGSLQWPREGNGIYWSIELDAARKAGTVIVEWRGHWRYSCSCICAPFGDWVPEVYAARLALGKGVRGYPLKLALNSVYGKCCQSIGSPPFANPIWGGLITAYCRTRLIEGYTPIDPRKLVMLATDGLYVTDCQLDLPIGKELGDWEESEPDTIFVFKPGMYSWAHGKKVKTRGMRQSIFLEWLPAMEQEFALFLKYYENMRQGKVMPWPSLPIPQTLFINQRLALHLNAPEKAGVWTKRITKQSFDPKVKRRAMEAKDGHINTLAHLGGPFVKTVYYNRAIGIGTGIVKFPYDKVKDEIVEVGEFYMQTAAENYNLLISGLPDAILYDDDGDDTILSSGDIE